MSTEDENEKRSLDDAIERLEAEHRRRINEKVERGEVVRVTLDPVVVGRSESVEKAIEFAKAEALARLRAAGEKREVIFGAALMDRDDEPIIAIITGVPRARWGEDARRIGDMKDAPGKAFINESCAAMWPPGEACCCLWPMRLRIIQRSNIMAQITMNSVIADAEIEITPEMIEAGLDAYWNLEREADPDERIVTEVFRAMILARP